MNISRQALEVFAPVLDKLTLDAAIHFGTGPLRLVPAKSEDRPFSHLLRLAVCHTDNDAPLSHLFVKVTKATALNGDRENIRARVAHDFATTRRVREWLSPYHDLGAVPPVACYPDYFSIATEQVEGPTLLDHLRRHAAWFPTESQLAQLSETMSRAGRWVRVFQAMDASGDSVTVDSLIAYIDHRLARMVNHAGAAFTQDDRRRVLQHLDWLGAQIPEPELREGAIHADMALGNILVSGRRIVVLDFAMAKRGTLLHDLTRLSLQVELLGVKPHIRASVIARLQKALLHGFDPALTAERPLFRLLTLLHRINHLTGLSITRTALHEAVYNSMVRQHHRRWIDGELGRRGAPAVL